MAAWPLLVEPAAGCVSVQTRRTFLRAAVGLGGLLGTGRAQANRPAVAPRRGGDTACVVFFLDGGPSHLDTFDPKPDAPAQIRGEFAPIQTTVPGTHISQHLPLLAGHAEHYSLVRSLFHSNPSHAPAEHQMLTGWMGSREGTARAVIETPSLGSIVACMRGPRRPGMPAYVAVPWSFHHEYGGSPFGGAAYLGPRYEPLESGHPPRSATEPFEIPTLKLPHDLSPEQIRTRRDLLGRLDGRAADPESGEMARRRDAFWEQAMDLLLDGRVRDAFHLAREPQPVRERYGAHEWGQGALLARRLVEAGVTFVMLQCGLRQDWDTHAANFSKMRTELLPPLDRAVSAFLADLQTRGLLEKTLVLLMGEFGRTPTVNRQAGRDHWASVFSVLVAGGGTNGGQVIGSSDRTGGYPRDRALHAHDLFATMYHVLGIDHTTLFHDRLGRPIPVLQQATPIRELL